MLNYKSFKTHHLLNADYIKKKKFQIKTKYVMITRQEHRHVLHYLPNTSFMTSV